MSDRIKKSKPWVSKHLALTCNGFSWRASNLLRDGISEDLELLTVLSKLDAVSYQTAKDLDKAIRAGKAGRKEAQEALKMAKEKQEAAKLKKDDAKKKRPNKKAEKANADANLQDLGAALWEISDWIDTNNEDTRSLTEIIEAWPENLQKEVDAHLVAFWSAGAAMRDKGIQAATEFLYLSRHHETAPRFRHDAERTAWLQGVAGKAFDWRAALEHARTINLQAGAEADARHAAGAQASA